jgi:phage-related holin
LLSIIENSGRMGLPVPDTIKKAVEVLKEKGGNK